jgi:hypothetical protein
MLKIACLISVVSFVLLGCRSSTIAFDQIVLLDVEGRSGGRDLWIDKDGLLICHHVKHAHDSKGPGLDVSHHLFALSEDQQSELATLLGEQDFFNIQTHKRYGIPGEVYVLIYVQAGDETRTVGKWESEKHPQFDPIYEYLLELTETARQTPAFLQNKRYWDWHPEGFPSRDTILKSAPKRHPTLDQ